MQNDLISRSALDVDLQNLVKEYNRNCESDKSAGAFEALYHLRLAPAVDSVEVVRCKECKHCICLSRRYRGDIACSKLHTDNIYPDFYCGCGERRADDG